MLRQNGRSFWCYFLIEVGATVVVVVREPLATGLQPSRKLELVAAVAPYLAHRLALPSVPDRLLVSTPGPMLSVATFVEGCGRGFVPTGIGSDRGPSPCGRQRRTRTRRRRTA